MNFEIIEEPIRFQLHGIGGEVENDRYADRSPDETCLT